jgi:hypothetical protein
VLADEEPYEIENNTPIDLINIIRVIVSPANRDEGLGGAKDFH